MQIYIVFVYAAYIHHGLHILDITWSWDNSCAAFFSVVWEMFHFTNGIFLRDVNVSNVSRFRKFHQPGFLACHKGF